MIRIAALSALVALAACSAQQTAAVNSVVVQGQSYCAIATAAGPVVAALINAADSKAVTVTGKAADLVAKTCAIVNGIPVVPPANPAAAPVIAVAVPAP